MEKFNIKKLTLTALFAAVAVVGSLFSFPVFGAKCAPVQHLVNILCAVLVGPWWGLAAAFIAALIRNLLALGSPLAFPGSMCGALLAGLLYQYGKKLPWAYFGEVFGTGIIGGLLSYPVALHVIVYTAAALFTFVVPFLISTCGGTIIAIIVTVPLKKSGMLAKMREALQQRIGALEQKVIVIYSNKLIEMNKKFVKFQLLCKLVSYGIVITRRAAEQRSQDWCSADFLFL